MKTYSTVTVTTEGTYDNLVFYDIRNEPFLVHGLYHYQTENPFRRMPQAVADKTSKNVARLNTNPAGGRVRFCTDSSFIAVKIVSDTVHEYANISFYGACGVDLYQRCGEKYIYKGVFPFSTDARGGYDGQLYVGSKEMREFILHLPSYDTVYEVYIGLEKGALLTDKVTPYRDIPPVLFYGSSITQGASASHPGNSYQNFISRKYNLDYINLGFSGSCLAEESIVDYLCTLNPSVFVLDYDHNAPNEEHLVHTHGKLYDKVRWSHPETPILLITKPDFDADPIGNTGRRVIIRETYERAVEGGDSKVWFLDGETLFDNDAREDCTVEGCHPNDLGLYRMSVHIGEKLREILSL